LLSTAGCFEFTAPRQKPCSCAKGSWHRQPAQSANRGVSFSLSFTFSAEEELFMKRMVFFNYRKTRSGAVEVAVGAFDRPPIYSTPRWHTDAVRWVWVWGDQGVHPPPITNFRPPLLPRAIIWFIGHAASARSFHLAKLAHGWSGQGSAAFPASRSAFSAATKIGQ